MSALAQVRSFEPPSRYPDCGLSFRRYTGSMARHFNERWFKVTSPDPAVSFVVVGWDELGWKMDVYGREAQTFPDGDTLQDSFDELFPFLAKYTDADSQWVDFDTGVPLSLWDALKGVTGDLD